MCVWSDQSLTASLLYSIGNVSSLGVSVCIWTSEHKHQNSSRMSSNETTDRNGKLSRPNLWPPSLNANLWRKFEWMTHRSSIYIVVIIHWRALLLLLLMLLSLLFLTIIIKPFGVQMTSSSSWIGRSCQWVLASQYYQLDSFYLSCVFGLNLLFSGDILLSISLSHSFTFWLLIANMPLCMHYDCNMIGAHCESCSNFGLCLQLFLILILNYFFSFLVPNSYGMD